MKKKIFALFLSVLMVTTAVFAGSDLDIELDSLFSIVLKVQNDVVAESGQQGVTVDVLIEGNDGISGGAFNLEFDDTVFTLAKEPEAVDIEGYDFVGADDLTTSPYYTSFSLNEGGEAIQKDGVLVRYTFNVKSGAPAGEYEIKVVPAGVGGDKDIPLEFLDENREPVSISVHFGKITVTKPPYVVGDANNDGIVNNRDAARILQYVAGWDVEINLEAANVNGDTAVNNRDAARILQYVAGWDVTLG